MCDKASVSSTRDKSSDEAKTNMSLNFSDHRAVWILTTVNYFSEDVFNVTDSDHSLGNCVLRSVSL